MTIESFDSQLFPDRGPTTLIGYVFHTLGRIGVG
jgi:hypothetical protein